MIELISENKGVIIISLVILGIVLVWILGDYHDTKRDRNP